MRIFSTNGAAFPRCIESGEVMLLHFGIDSKLISRMLSCWMVAVAMLWGSTLFAADLFVATEHVGTDHKVSTHPIVIPHQWIKRQREIAINKKLLNPLLDIGVGNAFEVATWSGNLFPDAQWLLQEELRKERSKGVVSWMGRIVGDEYSIANMVFDAQGNAVGVFYRVGQLYVLLNDHVVEIDLEKLPEDSILAAAANNASRPAKSKSGEQNNYAHIPVFFRYKVSQLDAIHHLWSQLVVDQTNSIWANSGAKARVSFAGIDTLGAESIPDDVFTLVMDDNLDYCVTGLQHDMSQPMLKGFTKAAVNTLCGAADFGVARAIGYAMGLGREATGTDTASMAHAVAVGDPVQWRTLMASRKACGETGDFCPRLPVLSNATRFHQGFALGDEKHDNSRALDVAWQNFARVEQERFAQSQQRRLFEKTVSKGLDENKKSAKSTDALLSNSMLGRFAESKNPLAALSYQIPLPNGEEISVQKMDSDAVNFAGTNTIRWQGKVIGPTPGLVNLVYKNARLQGLVHMGGKVFRIDTVDASGVRIAEVDPNRLPDEHPLEQPVPQADSTVQELSGQTSLLKGKMSSVAEKQSIDVLILYTDDAEKSLLDIESEAVLAVDNANLIYQQADLPVRLNLVGLEKISYKETNNFNTDLVRLKNKQDSFLDDAHPLRERYGADIVSLWVASSKYCGYGYMMTNVSSDFADWAFNVISTSCALANLSFVHELGHNMGLNHDIYVSPSPGAYADSHGFVNLGKQWRTIMAYNNACAEKGSNCVRIPYFSGDKQEYLGEVIGDRQANEVKTIAGTAGVIAAFRDAPAPQPAKIEVAGSWDGWSSGNEMKLQKDFTWSATLNLARGALQFGFIVDEDWSNLLGNGSSSIHIPQHAVFEKDKGNSVAFVPLAGDYRFDMDVLSGKYSVSRVKRVGEDWRRTVILIGAKLQKGQAIFLRGGVEPSGSPSSPSSKCDKITGGERNLVCAIPVAHESSLTTGSASPYVGDYFLDWGNLTAAADGREPSQTAGAGTPVIWTTNNVKHKKTVSKDGAGYTPLNTYGADYWMLDVAMDCSKTLRGWFEARAYLTGKRGGWEAELKTTKSAASNVPYASTAHWAQCGKINVFKQGQAEVVEYREISN